MCIYIYIKSLSNNEITPGKPKLKNIIQNTAQQSSKNQSKKDKKSEDLI